MPSAVCVALGSNLGDRRGHLLYAVDRLTAFIDNLRVSSFIETEPVGVDGPQPPFLNAAATGETALSAREVLGRLLSIERDRGRTRLTPRAARTLDLDLILYGTERIAEPDLIVPHSRFHEREFVLEPLVEIAPDWVDPISGKRIAQLLAELRAKNEVQNS